MAEILHAVVNEENVVENIIVVGPDWDQPTIPIGEYAVFIGCTYNISEGKFYTPEGSPVLTHTEIDALIEAAKKPLLEQ